LRINLQVHGNCTLFLAPERLYRIIVTGEETCQSAARTFAWRRSTSRIRRFRASFVGDLIWVDADVAERPDGTEADDGQNDELDCVGATGLHRRPSVRRFPRFLHAPDRATLFRVRLVQRTWAAVSRCAYGQAGQRDRQDQ